MVKLSEIKGAVPFFRLEEHDNEGRYYYNNGFNVAIIEICKREITLNRNKLAETIYEHNAEIKIGWKQEHHIVQKIYLDLADSIIANLKDIVEVKGDI